MGQNIDSIHLPFPLSIFTLELRNLEGFYFILNVFQEIEVNLLEQG